MSDRSDSPETPPLRRSDRKTSQIDRWGYNPRRSTYSDTDDDHRHEVGAQGITGADTTGREDGEYMDEGAERPRSLHNIPEVPAPLELRRTVPPPTRNPDTHNPPGQEGTRPRPSMAASGDSTTGPASPVLSAEDGGDTFTIEDTPARNIQ